MNTVTMEVPSDLEEQFKAQIKRHIFGPIENPYRPIPTNLGKAVLHCKFMYLGEDGEEYGWYMCKKKKCLCVYPIGETLGAKCTDFVCNCYPQKIYDISYYPEKKAYMDKMDEILKRTIKENALRIFNHDFSDMPKYSDVTLLDYQFKEPES